MLAVSKLCANTNSKNFGLEISLKRSYSLVTQFFAHKFNYVTGEHEQVSGGTIALLKNSCLKQERGKR